MNTTEAVERINQMRREKEHVPERYELAGVELVRANDFRHEHDKRHGTYSGAIGGRHTVEFTRTSLGTAVWIRCGHCGEKTDCTEYDW